MKTFKFSITYLDNDNTKQTTLYSFNAANANKANEQLTAFCKGLGRVVSVCDTRSNSY